MHEAIGIVEMFGFVTAISAADAAEKAAVVLIIPLDSNKPADPTVDVPLIMAIKMQGSVSAVKAGVEAAAAEADRLSGLINKHIIASPTDDTQKMAERISVGRDKVGHIPMNA